MHTRTTTTNTMEMIKTLSVTNPEFFDGGSIVVPLVLVVTGADGVGLIENCILSVSDDAVQWILDSVICEDDFCDEYGNINVEKESVVSNDSFIDSDGKIVEIDSGVDIDSVANNSCKDEVDGSVVGDDVTRACRGCNEVANDKIDADGDGVT